VPEPAGGAHSNHTQAADLLRPILRACLDRLSKLPPAELIKRRQQKFRRLASFVSES
jgi:acetyl-CoA carboxylase alpha subunit